MFGALRRTPVPAAGRRRPRATAPTPASSRMLAVPVAVAAVDTANIDRERALRQQIGHGLQGGAGTVVGYDRGDPTHTITGPIPTGRAQRNPTTAFAAMRYRDEQRTLPQSQANELGSTDPHTNAYRDAKRARIGRRV